MSGGLAVLFRPALSGGALLSLSLGLRFRGARLLLGLFPSLLFRLFPSLLFRLATSLLFRGLAEEALFGGAPNVLRRLEAAVRTRGAPLLKAQPVPYLPRVAVLDGRRNRPDTQIEIRLQDPEEFPGLHPDLFGKVADSDGGRHEELPLLRLRRGFRGRRLPVGGPPRT